MTSYIFYGYQFKKSDIATKYQGLDFQAYPFQVIPEIEKYLTNASGIKIGSLAAIEREGFIYIGFITKSLKSGYNLSDAEDLSNMFTISVAKQIALTKGWKDFKLTKSEMSSKLGYYFV